MMPKNLPINLTEGLVVEVYLEEKYQFDAELVKRVNTWRDLEPYPYYEPNYGTTINAVKEQWLVRVISEDPFSCGREYVRWIPKFHSKGLLRINDPIPLDLDLESDLFDDVML